MILRILTLLLAFTLPLSATLDNNKVATGIEIIENNASCNGCNDCRQQPSAFESLQTVQGILNNNILLLPQLQPQLVTQLQQIVTTGGIGVTGATGPTGATGASSGAAGALDFADFYATMGTDNPFPPGVLPNTAVQFPQDGPSSGTGLIARVGGVSPSQFNLTAIGFYQVLFQMSVSAAGQAVLTLDSGAGADELEYTVVGRATGSSQIIGMAIVQTTVTNSILAVHAPAGDAALQLTVNAGGVDPVTAHLVITRLR